MSNFTAFRQDYLESLIEPFLPGATDHITPIRFEAITPDIFAFLFRTTGKNDENHYFIALEYDYLQDIEAARAIIEDWHRSFIEFWAPESNPKAGVEIGAVSIILNPTFRALLAKVEPPRSPSYWSDSKVLRPGEDLDAFLEAFPEEKRVHLRKNILDIRQKGPKASISVHIDQRGHQHYYYK